MQDESDERRVKEIRTLLRDLGRWPADWGAPTHAVLLDLYDIFEAIYQAAGRPFGDSMESLLRWWHEG